MPPTPGFAKKQAQAEENPPLPKALEDKSCLLVKARAGRQFAVDQEIAFSTLKACRVGSLFGGPLVPVYFFMSFRTCLPRFTWIWNLMPHLKLVG
jgi:hypothetical protein